MLTSLKAAAVISSTSFLGRILPEGFVPQKKPLGRKKKVNKVVVQSYLHSYVQIEGNIRLLVLERDNSAVRLFVICCSVEVMAFF